MAQTIFTEKISTPLGEMLICATNQGICLLEFSDKKKLDSQLKDLKKRFNADIVSKSNEHIQLLKKELKQYFAEKLKDFSVKIDLHGTDFQKQVWQELQNIPYGETRSYLEQAKKLGRPKSVRAIANANGRNRIAIVIPCHRVIGANGSLTGYSGGLLRKKSLIDLECQKN